VSMTIEPLRVRVRMYQVGFGDSILVSVEYAGADSTGRSVRHILFDFGSTRQPRSGAHDMTELAGLIKQHTGGTLDILVVTHRHKDHLSAFGDADVAQTFTALAPKLVLRPWTEQPDLPADASGAGLFAALLASTQQSAQALSAHSSSRGAAQQQVERDAADQLPNQQAITVLDTLSAAGRGRYLHLDSSLDVTDVVPGLTMTLLGPPTIAQSPEVETEASRDPEYWMLRQLRLSLAGNVPAADGSIKPGRVPGHVPPGPVRWLVEHVAAHHAQSSARLVRRLDEALNNTSLILLLEIGGLTLLFPGDAQIENWRPTLDRIKDDAALRAKLTNIDLYKVGHHGSRNATPRSLYTLWTERPADAPRPTALMSTLSHVHGSTEATRVPRATLVEALAQVADLHSTEDLDGKAFIEVVADASGGPFVVVS
jgi:hypothetical protein